MELIEAREVSKVYEIGARRVAVLDAVSLAVGEGELLVIEGASGSGKTTLLSILSGLDRPSSGRVFLDGRESRADEGRVVDLERGGGGLGHSAARSLAIFTSSTCAMGAG